MHQLYDKIQHILFQSMGCSRISKALVALSLFQSLEVANDSADPETLSTSRQHCLLPLPLASHVVAKVAVDFAVLFLTEFDFLRASFFISPLELLTGT